jgi:phage/plasmid-like protein (TIGR03299 family)
MPAAHTLNVALRAYVPAFEQIGAALPATTVTLTNIDECRRAAGLDWEPATEPQYRVRSMGMGAESVEPVDGLKYVTRGPGGPVLGSLSESYHLFSNAELFGVAETIGVAALERGREVRFLAGGEVAGGKRVYLLADLGTYEIPGDPSPHVRYMTLLSSHNGGGSVKVLGTDFRWFCTNAVRAAEMQAAASGAAFSFRHTARIAKRLEDSRKAITAALLQHDKIAQATAEMLAVKIDARDASAYLRQFALAQVAVKGDRTRTEQAGRSAARANAVDKLEGDLAAILDSPTCEGIRGSAYGPFAAVVEYLDNVRPAVSPDTRFDRTMVYTERGKSLAYQLARDVF